MTRRERVLATTLGTIVFVFGGGILFHLFVYEPVSEVTTRLEQARSDYLTKQTELAQEQRQIKQILDVNPRLSQWQRISLPPRDPEAKKKMGVSLEEQKRRHLAQLQVEYERYLSELLTGAGIRSDTIVIAARQADRRTASSNAKEKAPPFEKLAFQVSGKGSLDSAVRVLREFHKAPLLHQIRNISVAVGNSTTSSRSRASAAPNQLDLSMTVEALLVPGAEERSTLLPSKLAYAPRVLAEPTRDYSVLTKRNMYTGMEAVRKQESTSKMSEKPADVLRFIKLTTLFYNPDRRRWEATLYDQATGPKRVEEEEDGVKKVSVIWEQQLNTRILNELTVRDRYENTLLDGKVVLIDEHQLIFKADKKFYRLRCGDTLHPAIEKPLSDEEVKELGLEE